MTSKKATPRGSTLKNELLGSPSKVVGGSLDPLQGSGTEMVSEMGVAIMKKRGPLV